MMRQNQQKSDFQYNPTSNMSEQESIKTMYRSGTMPISLPKISKINGNTQEPNSSTNRYSFSSSSGALKQKKVNTFHKGHELNNHSFMTSRLSTKKRHPSQQQGHKSFRLSFREDKTLYTQKLNEEVLNQKDYPYIESQMIFKQHSRLKEILKQFNDETVQIMEKYILQKPIVKDYYPNRPQVEELREIRAKEVENNATALSILKKQMELLQMRCQNLKYTSFDEFQHRIKELKSQKQRRIAQNRDAAKEITLNGLHIVRGKDSLVKQLEYDSWLVDTKLNKLRAQKDQMDHNLKDLEDKTKVVDASIQQIEEKQSYTLKVNEKLEQEKAGRRLSEEYKNKRKLFEHNKTINASTAYQQKHQYFQKLKQLEQINERLSQQDKKLHEDYCKRSEDLMVMIGALEENEKNLFDELKSIQIKNSSKVFSASRVKGINEKVVPVELK